MITFVGDVHAKFEAFKRIGDRYPLDLIIQVGDLGLGFADHAVLDHTMGWRFIRGNHDHPDIAAIHPCYMGDYGYWIDNDLFYASGAYSIDAHLRVNGLDWWGSEELSITDWYAAIDLYGEMFPKIVVTHDCPTVAAPDYVRYSHRKSRTQQALDALWDTWAPELWVFGHHHSHIRNVIEGTQFVGLAELECYRHN